jgi:hypothetical protein
MRNVLFAQLGGWCLALLAALVAAGCGGDDTTGPGGRSIEVTLTVCALPYESGPKVCPASTLTPEQPIEVSVQVVARGGATIELIMVEVTGPYAQVDSFVPLVPGATSVFGADTVILPAAVGSATLIARAEGGGVSGASEPFTLVIDDQVPPALTQASLIPADSLEPGDSVRVAYTASDNASLARIVIHGAGALPAADTLFVGGRSWSDTAALRIPPSAPYGSQVALDVKAIDAAGLESPVVSITPVALADYTRPSVGGYLYTGITEPLVPGDTLRGYIEAADNHRLAWVGYRVGSPVVSEDSFPVSGLAVTHDFEATVEAGWVGTPNVVLFARDSTGNIEYTGFPLTITVIDAVRRPYDTVDGGGAITDLAYDAKRDVLYLLDPSGIAVLDLSTLTYDAPITLPVGTWSAGALDLSPGMDTLAILVSFFPDTATLGLVDLTQASPAIDTVHLVYDKALGMTHDVGIASNNKALISLHTGTGDGGLLEFDLATGAQTRRLDAGASGTIPTPAKVLVSGDRQKLALSWMPVPCCPNDEGQVYDAASDAFGSVRTLDTSNSLYAAASADDGGDRYLIGGYLLDGSLATVDYFDYPTNPDYPASGVESAISADGLYGYFSQETGGAVSAAFIVKVRLADDTVIERILLPAFCRQLMVLPDGETLFGTSATAQYPNTIFLIDLR